MSKKYLIVLFVLTTLILFSFPKITQSETATLYFSPPAGTFSQGDNFWITIMVNTKGEAVNALAAYFSYPEDKLEALGVSTAGSVMTIWAEKKAEGGKIEIAGGLPTPGFSGIKKIASVGFKVKVSSGSVNFKFNEDSAVLTDAENKNILNLTYSGQGNYNFKPKSVTTPPIEKAQPPIISEVKIEERSQNEVTISWKTDQEADSTIEYGLTSDYGLITTDEKLTKEHSLIISGLSPGTVYYFKLKNRIATDEESETENLTFSPLGYQVGIKILNFADNQPLIGAEVVFPGPPQTIKTTNQEGRVLFDHLPLGRQWISVKYDEVSLSYPLDISAEEEIQRFEVLFKTSTPGVSPLFVVLVIFLIGLVTFLVLKVFKLWKFRRKNEAVVAEKPEDNKKIDGIPPMGGEY